MHINDIQLTLVVDILRHVLRNDRLVTCEDMSEAMLNIFI